MIVVKITDGVVDARNRSALDAALLPQDYFASLWAVAACVAAALRPDVIGGVVALGGYSIQDIAAYTEPALPWMRAVTGTSITCTANAGGPA